MSSTSEVPARVSKEKEKEREQEQDPPRQPAPRVKPLLPPPWYFLAFPAPVLAVYVLLFSAILAAGFKHSFTYTPHHFTFVAAIYFTVVAISSVGLGDIVPLTREVKIATCCLLLIGRFVFAFFSLAVSDCLHRLEDCYLDRRHSAALTDQHGNPRVLKRLLIKFLLTLAYAFLFFWPPIFALHRDHHVGFGNAAYTSISSMTTTGFGDFSFNVQGWRGFAAVWILFSTCLFERAHALLVEIWLRKRWIGQVDEVLSRQFTLDDFTVRDGNGNVTARDYSQFRLLEKLMRDLGLMEQRYLNYVQVQHENLVKIDVAPAVSPV